MNRLLALLLPLLLLAGAAALLARPEPPGAVPPEAKTLDQRVEKAGGVDVAVLGNSKVGTDLDLGRMAGLFADGSRIVPLGVNGTGAPVWYAVLKNRVYAHGQRPKTVVVYATLRMMLQVDLPSEIQRKVLAAQLLEPDAVLNRKVFGAAFSDPRIQRILTRRTELRQGWTESVRDLATGLVLAPPGDGTVAERGEAWSTAALGRVFGVEQSAAERSRVLPVVERLEATDEGRERPVAETLVPDLIDLAQQNGAQIVFIRAPLGSARRHTDVVDPDTERAFVELLAARGAAWIDLHTASMPDAAFGDGAHMSKAGRERFTPQLVAAMEQSGVGGTLVAADPALIRPKITASRVGSGPALPALAPVRGDKACDWRSPFPGFKDLSDSALSEAGLGPISPFRVREDGRLLAAHGDVEDTVRRCAGTSLHQGGVLRFSPTGDDPAAAADRRYVAELDADSPLVGGDGREAWWVYPGTGLRLEVPEPPGGPARVWASVRVVRAGEGLPRLAAGAGEATFTRVGDRLEASVEAGPVRGAWTVEIHSPADGPWLLVERVATGTAARPWYLVGRPAEEPRVDLLRAERRFAAPPPELPTPTGSFKPNPAKAGSWTFPVGELGVPNLEESFAATGASCSPLRLYADGEAVAATPKEKRVAGVDKLLHSKERVLLELASGGDPRVDGRSYRFGLDPERACLEPGRWLYPGDQLELRLDRATTLRRGATELQLAGAVFRAEGSLGIELFVGEERRFQAEQPLAGWTHSSFVLPSPVGPEDRDLRLRLVAPPQGWVLLGAVDLVEERPAILP